MTLYKYLLSVFVILITAFLFSSSPDENLESSENEETSKKAEQEEKSVPEGDSVSEEEKIDKNSDENLEKYDTDQNFNIKLRNIEEKINSLKDRVFRAKQRLSVLKETVLTGAVAGARAEIIQNNEIGGAFKLVSAIYYLDDTPVFKRINNPDAFSDKKIVIFDESVLPGPHHVSVYLEYEGAGYGVFSYMEGYKFKIRAGHSFNIEEGKVVVLKVIPQDRGVFYDVEERLNIEFDVTHSVYEKTSDDH
ncbi:MAG: hypothetical protein R6W70_07730 [bacterium]